MHASKATLTQGEQDRLNIGSQSKADIDKIGAGSDQDRKTIGAQTEADVTKMEKGDELTAKKANRQQARARSLARAF